MAESTSSQAAQRLSTDSTSSVDSVHYNSTTPLILSFSPDQDSNELPEIDDDDDEQVIEHPSGGVRGFLPVLPTSTVFVFSLAPYLKLGAILLANDHVPLEYGLPSIFVFALLSALSRHLLFLLSGYLRKEKLEDLVLDAFARGRRRQRWRKLLTTTSRFCTGGLRVLLVAIYLRECSNVVLSLFPATPYWSSRVMLSIFFAMSISALCSAPSVASKRVVYATWASVAAYVLWLGCVIYANSQGTTQFRQNQNGIGTLWQGITITAFAFTSPSTLFLAASLSESGGSISTRKSRFRSFEIVSITSVALAAILLLPLPIMFRHPNRMQGKPETSLQTIIGLLNINVLLLAIPYILDTAPAIPLPGRIQVSTRMTLSKIGLFLTAIFLSLLSNSIIRMLSDILLVSALSGTYLVPAFLHIASHQFRRPQTIVLPPQTHDQSDSPSRDELLQRKERELQRRRKARRIVWDIGVWVLLVPIGSGGFVWAAGRIAGRW